MLQCKTIKYKQQAKTYLCRRKFAVPSYSTIPESEQLSGQGQPASSGAHNKPSTFHTGLVFDFTGFTHLHLGLEIREQDFVGQNYVPTI